LVFGVASNLHMVPRFHRSFKVSLFMYGFHPSFSYKLDHFLFCLLECRNTVPFLWFFKKYIYIIHHCKSKTSISILLFLNSLFSDIIDRHYK
jgi:hypothetical protein